MSETALGYHIEHGVFSPGECDAILAELSNNDLPRSRAGARHLMSHAAVARVARDAGLLELARPWVGAAAVPYRATLFEKTAAANWLVVWHQDTALPLQARFEAPGWGPWSQKAGVHYAHAPSWALARIVALRLHLDASTRDNGPLRVIPSSHVCGVLSDDEVARYAADHAAVECPAPRGGALAMRPLLIHASSKALVDAPRRVLHIEYVERLELAPGIHLAIA